MKVAHFLILIFNIKKKKKNCNFLLFILVIVMFTYETNFRPLCLWLFSTALYDKISEYIKSGTCTFANKMMIRPKAYLFFCRFFKRWAVTNSFLADSLSLLGRLFVVQEAILSSFQSFEHFVYFLLGA